MLQIGMRYAWVSGVGGKVTWVTGLFTGQYDNCGRAFFMTQDGHEWIVDPLDVVSYKEYLQKYHKRG